MLNNLHPTILKSLEELKISKLTSIQEQSIPEILAGKNVVGLSETGSGKTLAFIIPTITKVIGLPKKEIKLLILTPTKELCSQIHLVVKKMTKHNQLLSLKIIGGENPTEQVRNINKGIQILVATPGRLQDLVLKNAIDLSSVDTVVLDEADVMMDMGYHPQIKVIIEACQNRKQTLLFSATMSDEAKILVDEFISNHHIIDVNANRPKDVIEEYFCDIKADLKIPFLKFLIKAEKIRAGLIFSNTKEGAKRIFEKLKEGKYKVELIEGEMSTHARKKALDRLKRKEVQFLVATDVASRGIDIPHITHIINFEVPLNKDSYIHRIGRTARHDKSGKAYTLCQLSHDEHDILRIKEEINLKKFKDFDYNMKVSKK